MERRHPFLQQVHDPRVSYAGSQTSVDPGLGNPRTVSSAGRCCDASICTDPINSHNLGRKTRPGSCHESASDGLSPRPPAYDKVPGPSVDPRPSTPSVLRGTRRREPERNVAKSQSPGGRERRWKALNHSPRSKSPKDSRAIWNKFPRKSLEEGAGGGFSDDSACS